MSSTFNYIIATYNTVYDTYCDEHEIVKIDEKQPQLGNIGLLAAGDSNSQFMTFEINRYYDNIDLSDKIIKFTYFYKRNEIKKSEEFAEVHHYNEMYHHNPCYDTLDDNRKEHAGKHKKDIQIYSDNACNICCNDTKVRFSWLMPAQVAEKPGKIIASISFTSADPLDHYELKTTIFELEIHPSLTSNDNLINIAGVNWFNDIESRLYLLEQVTGNVDLDYNTLINKPSINGVELDGDVNFNFVEGMASPTNLGGVRAVAKTDDMTYAVGIDENGLLWTKPSSIPGGGSGSGQDGFSPIVSMTAAADGSGTTLSILDKNGLKSAFIANGANGVDGINGTDGIDGIDGANGKDGADGFSPVVTLTAIPDGNRLAITDKTGTKYIDVMNGTPGRDGINGVDGINGIDGKDGVNGIDGTNGKDGVDGKDGFSPYVTIDNTVPGQHTIHIIDTYGDHSYTVIDGQPSYQSIVNALGFTPINADDLDALIEAKVRQILSE